MQIKHRITVVYTVIVSVVLLLICICIYIFSHYNVEKRFQDRLVLQSNSVADLIENEYISDSTKALLDSSSLRTLLEWRILTVYNFSYEKVFSSIPAGEKEVPVSTDLLQQAVKKRPYYFMYEDKTAVLTKHKGANGSFIILMAARDNRGIDWMNNLKWVLIVCYIVGVGIVFLLGYAFSIRLVQSISTFTQNIKRISSEKFSLRLDTGSDKDELQKLAVTINDLLDRLQASFDTQRRFIDNASHELSTPLASISSQLDVALQRERTSEEYKKALVSINDDVKRLSMLVRSLLEIAKVSGSMGGTELTSVRIDELLMELPSEMKKISPMYEVSMSFDELPESESSFVIFGNEHLLYSAFKNIVHNACKFSEDKGACVRLSFKEKHIVIKIEDKGPGIDSKDLKNIFQPFYRSHKHDAYVAGVGLGLSLAHRIIALHKGFIEVQSEEGKGTTFVVTLPLEEISADARIVS